VELKPNTVSRPAQAERRSVLTTIIFALFFAALVGEWYVEFDPVMYLGRWRSPFVAFAPLFAPLPMISLSLWQLLLIALAPICLTAFRARPERSRELDRTIFISIACIAVTFLWGLIRGGSPYYAYYQVWRFLTALLLAYLLMSVVRTPRDLATLAKLVVLAALIRATLCIYFYWTYLYGKVYPMPEFVTNHDDSILFVAATLIIGISVFVKGGKAAWMTALLVVPFVFYAMVLNDRRIAWVELALAVPAIYVLMGPSPLRSRINRWLVLAAPLLIVYAAVGWGREGALFAPLQAFSSAGSNYDPSSLTRQEEIRNLLYTLTTIGNPLFGTGWGVPYIRLEHYWSNYAADWTLVLYTPHNSLLGLAVFSGLVGLIGIWGVIPMAAFLAARGYRRSTELIPRGGAMVAVGCLAAYTVHTYGDVGLSSFMCNIIFGAALGTAGKIAAWSEALPATQPAAPPAGARRMAPQPRPTFRNTGATRTRLDSSSELPRPASGSDFGMKPGRAPRLPR